MKSKIHTRPKSLTTIKSRSELDITSPYLLPIKAVNPCLIIKDSKKFFKRKINTTFTKNNNSPNMIINLEDNPKFSTSCDTIIQTELRLDSDSSERKGKPFEHIYEKLKTQLLILDKTDYKKSSVPLLEIYNELMASDVYLGKILLTFKNCLILGAKNYYHSKLEKLNKEFQNQKKLNSTLKSEKDSLISKLNYLSSQNIDLMNSYEDLMKRYSKLENQFSANPSNGKNSLSMVQELSVKNETIKELSLKIEEMNNHENKLLQIFEKFNTEGVDIKKLYSQTPVRQGLFDLKRKKRNVVPCIDLTALEKI